MDGRPAAFGFTIPFPAAIDHAGVGLRDVAGEGDHEGEGVFCGRDGIPSWGIHDDDAGGRGGGVVRGGRAGWELSRIAPVDPTPAAPLAYFAQPGGREATVFPAVETGDQRVVFANPDNDFPQRIIYARAGVATANYVDNPPVYRSPNTKWEFNPEKAAALLDENGRAVLGQVADRLEAENDWTSEALEATTKALAEEQGLGLGKLAQPMRAALTGTTTSPGIFDVLVLLGRDEALARLDAQAA